jgi:hypothetical protein
MGHPTLESLRNYFDSSLVLPVQYPLLSIGVDLRCSFTEEQLALFQEQTKDSMPLTLTCRGGAFVFDERIPTTAGNSSGTVFALIFERSVKLDEYWSLLAHNYGIKRPGVMDYVPHMILAESIASERQRNFLRSVGNGVHDRQFNFSGPRVSDTRINCNHLVSESDVILG